MKPTTIQEKITPAKAEKYLSTRGRQRRMIERKVAELVGVLQRGEWDLNGDTIVFNTAGELVDGQNRLTACVKANIPIDTLVVRNVSNYAIDTIDMTAARTLKDVLEIAGETNTRDLQGIINLLWRWQVPRQEGHVDEGHASMRIAGRDATPASVRQLHNFFLTQHTGIRDCMIWGSRLQHAIGLGRGAAVTSYYLCAAVDEDDAEFFFTQLWRGTGLVEGDSIYTLRERLLTERHAERKLRDYEVLALLFKAWNAYRTGDNIRQLRWRAGGAKPEAFPEPR